MRMIGEQRVAAPRARVWEALNDPEVLRQCIPGCQSLDKESNTQLKATVEIKIGPIGARFAGAVTLSDLDPPNGYTITGSGQAGVVGSAKGGAKVRLTDAEGGTLLAYEVDAEVGGRMAQLGGPIIDATAKRLAGIFFEKFGAIVGGAPASAGAAPPMATASATAASGTFERGPAAPPPASLPGRSGTGVLASALAIVVAALIGFLVGRNQGTVGSDWAGLAIGLLLVVVAAAAFEHGRRVATSIVTLDAALLRRLARLSEETER